MSTRPAISLIFACYNEMDTLDRSLPRLKFFLDIFGPSAEVIFVDDGSRDDTVRTLREWIQANPFPRHSLQLIEQEKNSGRGSTVRRGFRAATGEVVGYLDIDFEVDLSNVIPAYQVLKEEKADLVIGARKYFWNDWRRVHRTILSQGYRKLSAFWLQIEGNRDSEAGFKFFRRDCAEEIASNTKEDGWFWDTEVTLFAQKRGWICYDLPVLFVRCRKKKSKVFVFRDSAVYLGKLVKHSRLSE